MAGTPAVEVRSLEDDELATRLREAKEELFNLRFQGATGQLENFARLRSVRRDIARLYTVLRERELGITGNAGMPSTGDSGAEKAPAASREPASAKASSAPEDTPKDDS